MPTNLGIWNEKRCRKEINSSDNEIQCATSNASFEYRNYQKVVEALSAAERLLPSQKNALFYFDRKAKNGCNLVCASLRRGQIQYIYTQLNAVRFFMHIEFDFITSLEFNLSSFLYASFILYRTCGSCWQKNAASKFVSDVSFRTNYKFTVTSSDNNKNIHTENTMSINDVNLIMCTHEWTNEWWMIVRVMTMTIIYQTNLDELQQQWRHYRIMMIEFNWWDCFVFVVQLYN